MCACVVVCALSVIALGLIRNCIFFATGGRSGKPGSREAGLDLGLQFAAFLGLGPIFCVCFSAMLFLFFI